MKRRKDIPKVPPRGDYRPRNPWNRKLERPPVDRGAERYFVYRCDDERGDALYVGRSCVVGERISSHRNTQPWGHLIASHSVIAGPMTWDEVIVAEREAIVALRPRFNREYITHNVPKGRQ